MASNGVMSQEELQIQQQMNFMQQQAHPNGGTFGSNGVAAPAAVGSMMGNFGKRENEYDGPSARRMRREPEPEPSNGIPRTIAKHQHLLEPTDAEGARLHAYYTLSIDELFRLPPTPSDAEFISQQNKLNPGSNFTLQTIPKPYIAALNASRFAEIALGALVHGEASLGMELCNAVVHCLRDSVGNSGAPGEETEMSPSGVKPEVMFTVAKTYFLLGIFRAYRGDSTRYYKYRRITMQYLSKMEDSQDTASLLSSISYQDAWAYMIHNGDERLAPNVDESIAPVAPSSRKTFANNTEAKFDVKTDAKSIAGNPLNKTWIQGPPPVYLNNEAPLNARSLDALACAVRTCCDQANKTFADIAQESGSGDVIPLDTINSATTVAVMSHEDELCSRNVVLSAYTLMQQHENSSQSTRSHDGQQLVISAMDAFLENGDGEGNGGLSESQISGLLSVCHVAIENPFLLYHAGPTYHMVSNAVVLLCHLLNGLHATRGTPNFGAAESKMFDDVLDTSTAVRKLLLIHREKLPVKLRCHFIPRPSFSASPEEPFIDLGETLLCTCRGCQGFVLMACSPCVAAERARDARHRLAEEEALERQQQEQEGIDLGEIDRELDIMGEEFNVDDDELLNMISSVITN
mmetsp:Transcript_21645/g.45197  ORF Transcript_21645/g.45197 Transcript_21645/m.45197 type:complete len:633 (-) Transcript_21645:471-2369(-)|eukprot:CAMPEP_0172473038 /NCGR_PEP_ID=MMETSP1065-20121228/68652_1 /TAXON_ID=265537 /ORGANISM="Amphiprora paludosa, Strain CCMP125" /LENGTH=632 /DNA_ID=CAMNT_0013231207 /DNA_START=680 /DNA_END=2578 /DNA_ORIENTATION=-